MLAHTIKENKQELLLCLWLVFERNTKKKTQGAGKQRYSLSHTVGFLDGLQHYANKELYSLQ